MLLGTATPAAAQIPPEWQAAAQAVIGDLERDTPLAAKPWTGAELTQGWNLARAWRRHNNGNIEIILAEYLTFVALCRIGCAGSTIEGQGYISVAEQVKALIAQNGGSYALASNASAWLAGLADPTGAAQKNVALWAKDPDVPSADFATGNLYALTWLLARKRQTPRHRPTPSPASRSSCRPRPGSAPAASTSQGGHGARRSAAHRGVSVTTVALRQRRA